ncbi:MAG: hypothetical protein ABFD07_19280 [Methanobacterium sp.]
MKPSDQGRTGNHSAKQTTQSGTLNNSRLDVGIYFGLLKAFDYIKALGKEGILNGSQNFSDEISLLMLMIRKSYSIRICHGKMIN